MEAPPSDPCKQYLNCRGDAGERVPHRELASPHQYLASLHRDLGVPPSRCERWWSDEKDLILWLILAKKHFNFRRIPFFFWCLFNRSKCVWSRLQKRPHAKFYKLSTACNNPSLLLIEIWFCLLFISNMENRLHLFEYMRLLCTVTYIFRYIALGPKQTRIRDFAEVNIFCSKNAPVKWLVEQSSGPHAYHRTGVWKQSLGCWTFFFRKKLILTPFGSHLSRFWSHLKQLNCYDLEVSWKELHCPKLRDKSIGISLP